MIEAWVLILGLAWGNPDSRVERPGDVLRIERVEGGGTREECEAAARLWLSQNIGGSGYARAFATCIRAPHGQSARQAGEGAAQ